MMNVEVDQLDGMMDTNTSGCCVELLFGKMLISHCEGQSYRVVDIE